MRLVLPRVYVILDAALLNLPEVQCAKMLVDAGVRLIQYRNKSASVRQLFESSCELAGFLHPTGVRFIVNDRADVAALADADGVHVGQDDLGVEQAREIVGAGKWVGVSTHNVEQFEERGGEFGGLCGGGTDFLDWLEGESRSGGGRGICAEGTQPDREADRGDWRNHAGDGRGSYSRRGPIAWRDQ